MHFRLKHTVLELWLEPEGGHTFVYGGPHNVSVELRAPSPEEQVIGHKIENAFCAAILQVEVNERNQQVFDAIANDAILPNGAPSGEGGWKMRYTGPSGTPIRLPALSQFPESFRGFAESVRRELDDYARRTVFVLRWRTQTVGLHNPISTRGLDWSADGQYWHPMPKDTGVRVEVRSGARIRGTIPEDVRSLVLDGRSEPLDHEMLREAWEQRYSNPRSALVIGMAAVELGIKRCVGTLIPDAAWLANNAPSPPLMRMLIEYLPMLPAQRRINDRVPAPPQPILDVVKKAVTVRNQLVHAGNTSPTGDDVHEFLQAVRDLLWLFDYYMGTDWAISHVRRETRAALGIVGEQPGADA